jgi:tRNA pseudouridine38-40 synthase
MRTLRLVIQYDGGEFSGWQRQPNQFTVQGVLTASLERILQEPVRVIGASRTDAGVHALGQVASMITTSELPVPAIRAALNSVLPPTIRINAVEEAPEGFDARRWAKVKRYLYLIENSPVASPLFRHVSWHVKHPLDRTQMASALPFLRGPHDFSAFCAAPGRGRSPICQIYSLHLRSRRGFTGVFFSADSFLHHMVRNIVGSVVEVGKGHRPPEWIGELLSSKDRTLAGPTAPAHGLVLLRVLYPREPGMRRIIGACRVLAKHHE